MTTHLRTLLAALAVATLGLAACRQQQPSEPQEQQPPGQEELPGTEPAEPGTEERTGFPAEEDEELMGEGGAGGSGALMPIE